MTRTAIVTGGGRGIGAAIAKLLGADGLKVAVLDMGPTEDTVAAIKADGGEARGLEADVSDEDTVNQAVEQIAATLGAPTVLGTNAVVLRDHMLVKITDEE